MRALRLVVLGFAMSALGSASAYELWAESPLPLTGGRPGAAAIGDINGDGLEDVVVGTEYSDGQDDFNVLVYLQQPDGGIAEPLKFPYAEWSDTVDLRLGDMNNDGILDIVVGYGGGVAVFLANGVNGFSPPSQVALPAPSFRTLVALMDIDGDGNLDIAAVNAYGGARLLYGDGRGGVRKQGHWPETFVDYTLLDDIAVGDASGDGRADIVVVSGAHDRVYIYPHNGIDGFTSPITIPSPGTAFATSVATGDFNHDGVGDIVLNTPGSYPNYLVWLYRGRIGGGFEPPQMLDSHIMPDALLGADLDRDGRDDLLVGHRGWAKLGRYLQADNGLGAEHLSPVEFNGYRRSLATGDVNDDGCTDAVVADVYGVVILTGQGCAPVRAVSDFDGDGRSDLFWHLAATGASAIWKGGDYRSQQRVVQITSPAWQVVGSGDFDGDGQADAVWHNSLTGAGAIWRSGNYATQLPVTRVTNLAWKIAGIGDFNGDGKADLLWRNASTGANGIWRSGNYRDQQAITGVTDLRWQVAGVDDFNGDGVDDILWRNASTGANVIWKSGNYRSQQAVAAVAGDGWQVAGTGDFNADGQADVLWRHARTGRNVLWHSADARKQAFVADMDRNWDVAAVGDYDGNRRPELLWRHRVTGENRLWRSLDGRLERPATNVTNTGWRVVD